MHELTRKLLAVVAAGVLLTPVTSLAAGPSIPLDRANNDVRNVASLQRGAQLYMNFCLGCHSAQFMRWNRIARDLQLTEEQVMNNLMFTGESIHDTMQIAMPGGDAEVWFGKMPPDLSLIARSRGTDYLYTFLRTFYVDENGNSNNKVLEMTSMPHVLWELQGLQRAVYDDNGDWTGFEQLRAGSMSPEEYDRAVRDLVNFLDYVGEPIQVERQRIGTMVIAFLLIFLVLSWLYKREVWRDVK
ncbi:MAG: cytochrome c1 [Gammaproteobacteria bacterium]|nr:cytochrome c1 [Gammaproteobacteria bacterium]TVQ47088.1 MAG: cytochrome c1 [Gammaproteobacteria bacterium]